MGSGKYVYDYPRPMVTVDAVVFSRQGNTRCVLLIQRKRDPFAGAWALPGGFVEMEETLDAAVARELAEETGLTGVVLGQLRAFGDPGRDPRGRTISVVFWGVVDGEPADVAGHDDAADARWFSVDALPDLAFDHDQIIKCALETLPR
ncbi:MAG TPA: NUDIX hydrolase [Candidatus Hydrogenedentes bacterium]|nr:NUDIX hydrolase [Candidatus Hydrogenedentota bacterium]HPG68296.1 NUDIX hydrolase [Candidatus Hydrogenedentota bacterium]